MLIDVLQKVKKTQPVTLEERELYINWLKTKDHGTRMQILQDPWAFLVACVYTNDEKDKDNPIKLARVDKDYVAQAVKQWKEEDTILVNKSRQLWFTWLYVSLCLHHVMFHTDQKVFFVSEDASKADALIERTKVVWDNIPEEIWPRALQPKMDRIEGFMKFKGIGSQIQALASGKDQMRSFTGSIVFDDECGFWKDTEETIGAQIPAVHKIVAVSTIPESFTAEPVYWWRLCFDAVDGVPSKDKDIVQLRKGMKRWKNPNNQFSVLEVHFTSDPEKDNPEWIRQSQRGYSDRKLWEREVNMKWTTSAGTPVYGQEFNSEFHVCRGYEPDPNFEIIRAWDFGFNQCCVLGQFIGGRLYIFDEIVAEKYFPGETHVGTKRFAPFVKEYCAANYKSFHFIDVVDPAGNAHEQGSEDKIIKPMKDAGLKPILGEKLFEVRRETVLQLLTRNKQGKPSFMIDPDACPTSYAGLCGGYQYPENKGRGVNRPDRPLKNKFSHTQDCIQYLACYSLKLARNTRGYDFMGVTIPDMNYSFTDEGE